ncbi:GNAT family N-acetyltransferase [Pseudonocardia charpentierae]|uniref:GNAT family N-acetyltransferase n=1 Tax=Pseudonocardia charpentierae TaxID=3075545 RepID=A0ABU2NH60_9PSEU|nr:GNAT family N-acetyltransferase [Pseudonocardia sp. DSM 45834]MDT0353280.1 GNAT family N-acetyltransferase [Pseudonocardia sp. DSM 45834]
MTTVLTTTTGDVRKALPTDAAAVASALAAAFTDDPVFRWILPDARTRPAATQTFFDLVVEILAPHDDAWTTTAGVTGTALWVPAGRAPMSDERAERFASEITELCAPHGDRVLELVSLMDEQHPHEPHEYLWFLGVIPTAQGHGLGSALMAPVLQRADRAGHPAYLEATSPRSKALYERHGFRAATPFAVAGGPPLWPMWRDPA